ncbi:MAG: dipeptidase [Anaerolineaceae bacterium]|nr:dipeptidase [Anaerolineaceae bacterium]MBN2677051.1 dipeptidase [Anaerolineaceae bacterium]
MPESRQQAINYAKQNYSQFVEEMKTFLAIPSVSTDDDHRADILRAANHLVSALKGLSFERVEIHETKRHPIVYAEKNCGKPGAKTVLIYGHYDVQPVDPIELWESDPFTPTQRGDHLYVRGGSDMKGQIWATLKAIESIQSAGSLPVNLKCIFEGEEELGSPNLEAWIAGHVNMLACDVVLNPDTGMLAPNVPTIVYGLRGLVYTEIKVHGPAHDLHSGLYGGVVHNPANVICMLIAGMKDHDGRITLPGFYDKVLPLSPEERSQFERLPFGDEDVLKQTGAEQLWGEKGFTSLERIGARPTLDVNGIYSGFIGEGSKTVIPAWSMAKISMRLVPDQDPVEIREGFIKYINDNIPSGVRWEFKEHSSNKACLVDLNSPAVHALTKAQETVWGTLPVYKREGGSVPVVLTMQKLLGVESVLTGFSLPDDNIHAPNERMHMPTWKLGIECLIHFFYNL